MSGKNTIDFPAASGEGEGEAVGILGAGYGLEKVSYLVAPRGYHYRKVRRLPLYRLEKLLRRHAHSNFWDETGVPLPGAPRLVHSFNTLLATGPRFVVTFESELPRYLGHVSDWQWRMGYRFLDHRRCRAALGLSQRAADIARAGLEAAGHPGAAAKVGIFRGAVHRSAHSGAKPDSQDALRLLFVGGDLVRKGIEATLAACRRLVDSGVRLTLDVVGDELNHSYVAEGVEIDFAAIRGQLATLPWLRHHPGLPNARIREMMFQADALIFPSLDESLGWVAVEAAMERTATIACDMFALPELVGDGETGRLIRIPVDRHHRWQGLRADPASRRALYADSMARIEQGLVEAVGAMWRDRGLARRWGEAAHARLAPLYDPDVARRQLEGIYATALAS